MRDLDQFATLTEWADASGAHVNSGLHAAKRLGIQIVRIGKERLIPRADFPRIAEEVARYLFEHRKPAG